MNTRLLIGITLLSCATTVHAHGDVSERIHRLDHAIEDHPNDTALWIERGRLHLDDGHAARARDDFLSALQADPKRVEAHYYLAQAQLTLGDADAALRSVQEFLDVVTSDAARARGLVLRGDILSASGKALDAADAYVNAVALSREIKPDHVLFAANAYREAGRPAAALNVLNEAVTRLGPLHVLNERALALELEQQRYDLALARVDRMLADGQRTPFLLYKKGVILKTLARGDEAHRAFTSALTEIDALSPSRRQARAMQELRASLQTALSGDAKP